MAYLRGDWWVGWALDNLCLLSGARPQTDPVTAISPYPPYVSWRVAYGARDRLYAAGLSGGRLRHCNARHEGISRRLAWFPPIRVHYTTFDKSGHLAPHGSCSLRATLRGQSAVISSDQSNSSATIYSPGNAHPRARFRLIKFKGLPGQQSHPL